MKTTLLLIAVAILCVGCNEEALKKKDAEIGELTAKNTVLQDENAKIKAERDSSAAPLTKLRPSGPEVTGVNRHLALPLEFGAAALFATLVLVTISALFRQMAQIDSRQGTLISWIMVIAGLVATVAASMVSPYWAGLPYTPFLWFATVARPTTWWGSLIAILIPALAFFGMAYFLLKLRDSDVLKKSKWGCSLIILGLVFFGSHYRLACFSVIWTFGSATGYLIYPLSIGEALGALLGTGAYLIANPESERWEKMQQSPHLSPEPSAVKWTDKDEEAISTFLARLIEFVIRIVSSRH